MNYLYIFDMGGVVVRNHDVFPEILAYLDISRKHAIDWGQDLFTPLMEGALSSQTFWATFARRSGLTIPIPENLFSKFFHPQVNEAVRSLVLQLKTQARVVCGTNTIEDHYAFHCQRGDYAIFDAVYASHKMGLAKPRTEFYRHILRQEGYPASQTVFIDDMRQNVEAAGELGIQALHFTTYERLMEQLAALKLS